MKDIKKPFSVRMTQLSWRKMKRTTDSSWIFFNVQIQVGVSRVVRSSAKVSVSD